MKEENRYLGLESYQFNYRIIFFKHPASGFLRGGFERGQQRLPPGVVEFEHVTGGCSALRMRALHKRLPGQAGTSSMNSIGLVSGVLTKVERCVHSSYS